MAKKLKYSPRKKTTGLFDLTGDLFAAESEPSVLDSVHPSIADFVVNRPQGKKQSAESDARADLEMGAGVIGDIDALTFISFGSGSSGNCAYIGDGDSGILIDAGVDAGKIKETLRLNGISFDKVKGICLTHDHGDHVRYVYSLVRKHPHIGVYCTPKTLGGMLRRHNLSRRIRNYHKPIYKEFPFRIGAFELTAFDVSHDGTDNAGYFISHGRHRFAVATDLGCITPRVDYYMRQAHYVMIESNYDAAMLHDGSYPMHLKARIAAANGHLDNSETARFIAGIYNPNLKNVFLCHLSQDNNTPDMAVETVKSALQASGVDSVGDGSGSIESRECALQLVALPRFEASPMFTLRID